MVSRQNQKLIQQEENYFIDFMEKEFIGTPIIWLIGNAERPFHRSNHAKGRNATLLWKKVHRNEHWCGFDREKLYVDPPIHNMFCGHACDGPVVMIHAQILARMMANYLENAKPLPGRSF